ncbi:MAG: diguanylate cyclase [Sulfurimonadaceae bacterium]|jgi:diguanylate cyclase (GGDEF)-like protein|nr:diguanylate cyclase [Sulfurimonadaceae bacterium]
MRFRIKKQYRFYGLVFLGIFIFLNLAFQYLDFLKLERERLESEAYQKTSVEMKQNLEQMILVKQKSTTAIALSIANDKEFIHNVALKNGDSFNYSKLIENFRTHTLYKNIWIQIMDKDANVLYRSWTKEHGENLLAIRQDLQEVIENHKIVSSVSPGRHNLSLRAIVPLIYEDKLVGMLEVISHFNSISKSLMQTQIESIVVLKKEFKKQLVHPVTHLFIGDYYVANLDASHSLMEYLDTHTIERYFNDSYKVEDGRMIVSESLKNVDGVEVGYYIMVKDVSDISQSDLDLYMFKWSSFSIIVLMGIMIIWSGFLYFAKARDKNYYLNVINTSNNIIIINDKEKIIEVNNTFYNFFKEFSSIEQIKKRKVCLCEYFVKDDGYISDMPNNTNWVEYLVENKAKENKVKLNLYGEIHYFSISASLISEDSNHFAIIMSEITAQENYKKELEYLSTTDALTRIGNRRYFQTKLQEEVARAKRYQTPFSMIIFDIDFFKKVNDEFGHDVGDQVLVEYTELIDGILRDSDIFCRIGGEEFVILSPHANLDEAMQIAQKVRILVKEYKKIVPITMSFGVVSYEMGENDDAMFKRADQALYRAKELGRDQVVSS